MTHPAPSDDKAIAAAHLRITQLQAEKSALEARVKELQQDIKMDEENGPFVPERMLNSMTRLKDECIKELEAELERVKKSCCNCEYHLTEKALKRADELEVRLAEAVQVLQGVGEIHSLMTQEEVNEAVKRIDACEDFIKRKDTPYLIERHRLEQVVIDAGRELIKKGPCSDPDCCDTAMKESAARNSLESALKALDAHKAKEGA